MTVERAAPSGPHSTHPQPGLALCFERCRVDTLRRELLVDDRLVDVQPLVFDLIEYFARSPYRVIGRSELLQQVWHTTHLSDSVLARAVMKARVAIGDDGRSPRLLVNVVRKGYRLDAAVRHEAPPAPGAVPMPASPAMGGQAPRPLDLAILPFLGYPDSSEGELASTGLLALLELQLADTGLLSVVPSADMLALGPRYRQRAVSSDKLCDDLGVRRIASCTWQRQGAEYTLNLQVDASGADSSRWHLRGPDATDLVMQAARLLCPTAAASAPAWPGLDALRLAARALASELAGHSAEALSGLQHARAAGARSPTLDLVEVRLALQLTHVADAESWMNRWWSEYGAKASLTLRVQGLLMTARCAFALVDHDRLMHAGHELLDLAHGHPVAALCVPELLGLMAQSFSRSSHPREAIRHAERAVVSAVSMGLASAEVLARVQLAQCLSYAGQMSRAEQIVGQLVPRVRQIGIPRLLAQVLLRGCTLQAMLRKFGATAAYAAEAASVFHDIGHVRGELSAREYQLFSLIESYQLDEADALVNAHLSPGRGDHYMQVTIAGYKALLNCRKGLREQGVAELEALARRNEGVPTIAQRIYDLEIVRNLVTLEQLDRARSVVQRMRDDPEPKRLLLAHALIALVEGDRHRCKDLLREVWSMPDSRSEESMDAAIDLAWLLLEDLAPAGTDDELEHLMAHAVDFPDEYLPASLLVSAYLLRTSPSEASRQRWERHVLAAAPLKARFAWMMTADYADALAGGRPRRAPELFSRVCW